MPCWRFQALYKIREPFTILPFIVTKLLLLLSSECSINSRSYPDYATYCCITFEKPTDYEIHFLFLAVLLQLKWAVIPVNRAKSEVMLFAGWSDADVCLFRSGLISCWNGILTTLPTWRKCEYRRMTFGLRTSSSTTSKFTSELSTSLNIVVDSWQWQWRF